MSKEQLHGLMHDALKVSDADQTEIVAMTSSSALTWYAENIIHQNVAEHTAQVQVRAVVGKKVGSASTTDCSPDGTQTLVVQHRPRRRHASRPMDPDFPGLPSPQPPATGVLVGGSRATAASRPTGRVPPVKEDQRAFGSEGTSGRPGHTRCRIPNWLSSAPRRFRLPPVHRCGAESVVHGRRQFRVRSDVVGRYPRKCDLTQWASELC